MEKPTEKQFENRQDYETAFYKWHKIEVEKPNIDILLTELWFFVKSNGMEHDSLFAQWQSFRKSELSDITRDRIYNFENHEFKYELRDYFCTKWREISKQKTTK